MTTIPKRARVAIAMVYLTCPECDESIANSQNGAYTFTSDNDVDGKHLDGKSRIKCGACGATVIMPSISFA